MFKEKKRTQKRVDTKTDALPTPITDDYRQIDKQVTNFYDDGEERFLNRELLRKKLRDNPDAATVIPQLSELETATRKHYQTLQKMSMGVYTDQLQLKLLMKQFESHSLFNVATKLAEYELVDKERTELKRFWSTGAQGKVTARVNIMPKTEADVKIAMKAAGLLVDE